MLEDFLGLLDRVKQTRRGYQARCPAHRPDKNPSLSIAEGERGLLVKCWSGCALEEITRNLGLTASDLFYESRCNSHPHVGVARTPVQPPRIEWRGRSNKILWFAEERWLRSERIFAAAKGKNILDWSGNDLDHAWEFVYSAFCDSEEAERLEDLAVKIRDLGSQSERATHASRR